jgi:hypothetical protein
MILGLESRLPSFPSFKSFVTCFRSFVTKFRSFVTSRMAVNQSQPPRQIAQSAVWVHVGERRSGFRPNEGSRPDGHALEQRHGGRGRPTGLARSCAKRRSASRRTPRPSNTGWNRPVICCAPQHLSDHLFLVELAFWVGRSDVGTRQEHRLATPEMEYPNSPRLELRLCPSVD